MSPRCAGKLILGLSFVLSAGLSALLAGPAESPADTPEITRWVRQLGDENFQRRDAASRALERIGEPALPALQRAADSSGDLEVRRRAGELVKTIRRRLSGEVLIL